MQSDAARRAGATADAQGTGGGALVGTRVGSYVVKRFIGQGGMAEVYLAVHPTIGCRAAVKVLRRELGQVPEIARRFVDEARAVATLRHHHTAQVYDLHTLSDGRPCILMEYVEGDTLEERLAKGPLSVRTAAPILMQLCDALGAAHAHGIVHCDVKAANVVLVRRGTQDFVKLIDFGIALQASAAARASLSSTVLGTPHYMAPEQIVGDPCDPRTDVYALGVLTFRVLTGRLPFDGANSTEVMTRHLKEPPPTAEELTPALREVIWRAMAKDKAARPRDALAFEQLLRGACNAITAEFRPPPPSMTPPAMAARAAPPPDFTAEVGRTRVVLHFTSRAAFERVQAGELSRKQLYVPWAGAAPDRQLRLTMVVPGVVVEPQEAELAVVVDEARSREWRQPVGFGLVLKGPAGRALRSLRSRDQLERIVEELAGRLDEDPYRFLALAPDAPAAGVQTALRRIERDLEEAKRVLEGDGRLASLTRALSAAKAALGDPERRARTDAARGNFRGVARALAAGLSAERLEELRRSYAVTHGDRLRRARMEALRAEVSLAAKDTRAALVALEAALSFDPLSIDLHRRYWPLKRQGTAAQRPLR